MEFHVDEYDFTFYCKPYLLKLHFPHEIMDEENAKAIFDPNKDNGTIIVHLPKKVSGQYFEDLDLLTKLLQPKESILNIRHTKSTQQAPLIQVVQSTDAEQKQDTESLLQHENESIRSNSASETLDTSLLDLENVLNNNTMDASGNIQLNTSSSPSYGFNNAYTDFFRCWHGHMSEIIVLPDPENTIPEQRAILREANEDSSFDVERYLVDTFNAEEDEYLDLAMKYQPFWSQYDVTSVSADTSLLSTSMAGLHIHQQNDNNATNLIFTEEEQELLRKLPNKEFLISSSSSEEMLVLGGLVDILIGFVYDHLTTQGERGIESAWTVSILSPSLSWLDPTANLHEVIRRGFRRMLTFPFLRQYMLAKHVILNVSEILKQGKRMTLRALLNCYHSFELSETQYLLNSLFISDYCVWIQSVHDRTIKILGNKVYDILSGFEKSEIGWPLEDWENAVENSVEEKRLEKTNSIDSNSSDESEESESEYDSSGYSSESEETDHSLDMTTEVSPKAEQTNTSKRPLIQELD